MANSQVNLRDIVVTLWHGKHVCLAGLLASVSLAAVYAFVATPKYRAEAVVLPRQDTQSGGMTALALQLSGLSELAGLPLKGDDDRVVAIATLRSRALVENFIKDRNLLPKLYKKQWDGQAGGWKDPAEAPTLWRAYNDFTKDILTVSEDRKTGLVTISIEWEDPTEASTWIKELIDRANDHLRRVAIDEGATHLSYLAEQSKSVGQIELRDAVSSLQEAELKKLMLAKGNSEFALKTIDPAVVPTEPSSPKRLLVIALAGILGTMLTASAVLLRRFAWDPSN